MANTLVLRGIVGSYGFSAEYVEYALTNLVGDVTLDITSAGGSYLEALSIVDTIRKCREKGQKVTARVGAYAFSAGSYITLACDEVEVAANALLMYHKPEMMPGQEPEDAEDLREKADILDKCYEGYKQLFMARTGKKEEEVDSLLEEDLHCTPEEAKKLGLVDRILPVSRVNDEVSNFKLPELVVNYVQRKNEEFTRMALKDVCNTFSIKVEDGKEEEALVNYIKELQVKAAAEPVAKPKTTLPGTIVNLVVRNRELELSNLVNTGKISVGVVNELRSLFTSPEHINNNLDDKGELVDSFDKVVNALAKNEEVFSFAGKSGTQHVPDPNKNGTNELIQDMEKRNKKG